ncbi:hypothetical protein [Microbulbifer sp. SAOS-129_SWC]|uniref:hypothetical protein n=1 Tax=Microbulbifer sp. SAOS-129_SWC TaxID=3145235 RepID=UPI003216DC78
MRLACRLLLTLLLLAAGSGRADGERYVFVVVSGREVDALDRETLRAIYSMRLQSWEDGSRVRVFVLPDDDVTHRRFVREILRMYPHQLRRSWDRAICSGMGEAPQVVASEEEMTRQLIATPGSIGYLSADPRDKRLYTVAINE